MDLTSLLTFPYSFAHLTSLIIAVAMVVRLVINFIRLREKIMLLTITTFLSITSLEATLFWYWFSSGEVHNLNPMKSLISITTEFQWFVSANVILFTSAMVATFGIVLLGLRSIYSLPLTLWSSFFLHTLLLYDPFGWFWFSSLAPAILTATLTVYMPIFLVIGSIGVIVTTLVYLQTGSGKALTFALSSSALGAINVLPDLLSMYGVEWADILIDFFRRNWAGAIIYVGFYIVMLLGQLGYFERKEVESEEPSWIEEIFEEESK